MQDQPVKKRKRGRPRNNFSEPSGKIVAALDRGMVVLSAVSQMQSATLSDLAQYVKMPPSTVHRILATLQNHGFVDLDSQIQEWAVGIGAFRVGSTYLSRSNLIEASLQVMRPLMEQTGETANLGIAEAGNVVFVSQVETQNPIRAMFRQGTGSPMHASGIGKALLAEMPEQDVVKQMNQYGQTAFTPHTFITPDSLITDLRMIAERGWAIDYQERYIGMCCVAAAVYNTQGNAIAGISVSGPSARFSDSDIAKIGPTVCHAADQLTELTGGKKPV